MFSTLFLRCTDWNPQFFREVKGRLKPRWVAAIAATSLLFQALVGLYFWVILPDTDATYNRYCTKITPDYYSMRSCMLDATGAVKVDWALWWLHLFQFLSWSLPAVLLLAGVYMLIGDIAKEEKRGTLNFIRLSPQTSRRVLLGKLLGVPVLPMLLVLLALPLHGVAAVQAGIAWTSLLSVYLITILVCGFLYTGAMFYAFLGSGQGWLGAIVVSLGYSFVYPLWSVGRSHTPPSYLHLGSWFHLRVGNELGLFVGLAAVTLAIGTLWNWLAANRRFRNPNRVVLSRLQSYGMTLSFTVLLFGFAFRDYPDWGSRHALSDGAGLLVANLFWQLLLIAALTPSRQTLLDWARYRHEGRMQHGRREWRRALFQDLVFGDSSPALVAIVINLLIPMVLWTPWILSWGESPAGLGLVNVVFNALFLLVCALLTQMILFSKAQKREVVAFAINLLVLAVPPVVLLMLGGAPENGAFNIFWLFSGFSFAALDTLELMSIAFGAIAYLTSITLLLGNHTRQLRKAGASEFKRLSAAV